MAPPLPLAEWFLAKADASGRLRALLVIDPLRPVVRSLSIVRGKLYALRERGNVIYP